MTPSTQSTLALLQSSSLADVVQHEIEQAILAGEYAPGAKLVEAAWADKLGVSRGPVREAFRMLDEAGLVRAEKNRGVHVRDIPLAEALEIFDLRAALEEMTGRHLASHITPAQLKEIKGLVELMKQAVRHKDADEYHLLNLQFHDRLVELTGNGKLLGLYRKLIKELALFRRRNLADSGALPGSVADHAHIVKAIGAGQPEAAGRALYEHVMQSKARTVANQQVAA